MTPGDQDGGVLVRWLFAAFCTMTFLTPPPVALAADPLSRFLWLVKQDKGLSEAEKRQWPVIAEEKFKGRVFSFDYSRLVYSVLSRAKFDEVGIGRGIQVAFDCALAVQHGGPAEEVEELAMLAFSTDLTPEEIARYAVAFHRCNEKGVPVHISQELIRHAKQRDWPAPTLERIIEGLLTAAPRNVDLEKIALFMMISVDQKKGAAGKIVEDALGDARRREPSRWLEARSSAAPASMPAEGPPVALDFDHFRKSVESFLGTLYLWGGNDRFGVDCSGFTRLVMKENGYGLPRTSREQARVGTPVGKEALRLGDLIFFDTQGAGAVTHVGIYLGGNLIVHASSRKGVTIVLFSDQYLQTCYLSARRVIRYRDR